MKSLQRQYQNARRSCQPVFAKAVDSLLAAVSPWRCLMCLNPAPGMDICADCLNDLPWLAATCRHCALPLTAPGDAICGACALALKPGVQSDIDLCIAALAYEFPVDRLVTGLKYTAKTEYARLLGELLSVRVAEQLAAGQYRLPDLLLPVPLHPRRLLQRGFNQAREIACWIARNHALPLDSNCIRRIRHTPGQAGLRRSSRLGNLRGAFAVDARVAKRRIAVVDDVVTTAATAREIARALKQGGAATVEIWAVARTID